ncbi:MAG: phosphoglucosamine mutase [Acidobacteriota bacterium]|nr:MAG: phosphoglucosamine mutase [Acidobacteriota bacterium]
MKLFGTDGIRGEADKFPFDDATLKQIGRGLADELRSRTGRDVRLLTARDTRESGERIETAITSGAVSAGGTCVSAGVMTTPGAAYLCGKFGFDSAVVISASHNPYHDNGIKIFLPSGQKLDASGEASIEAAISESAGELADSILDLTREQEFVAAYSDYLRASLKLSGEGRRIVIDCANGAASAIAPQIFLGSGADAVVINDSPDGRNINLGCGSTHIEGLQSAVLEYSADLGIAYDGDADRALFVDEKGDLIDGDATLLILARQLRKNGGLKNATVIATVMSNLGLNEAFAVENISLVRTAVGDKYVLERLLETGSELGGEQSGHIILPKRSLIGDGIMTSILLFEAMLEEDCTASELSHGFRQYPQVLKGVRVKEKIPLDSVYAVSELRKAIEERLGESGRLVLRYSGTEPLARVMIEGKDQAEIDQMADELIAVIGRELG